MGFFGKLLKVAQFILPLIIGIEPLFGKGTGKQKKEGVLGAFAAILGIAEAIAAKDIVDEGTFNEGLSQAIDGVVKMLNASVWHKSKVG